MFIQLVKSKSSLSDSDVRRVMEERAPQFRTIPCLIQKYYAYEEATGEYAGIYLWDSEQSLREYRESELTRTIPLAYKIDGQPRIEFFEELFPLRG